jgi:nitrous oxidase accessory protein NosD
MRKNARLLLAAIMLVSSCIVTALPVKAEARTIVVPDNYPTIASAVSNASNGDSVYVKNGTYNEFALVITKPISLIGENSKSTTINLDSLKHNDINFLLQPIHWYDPAMAVASDDFKLSGFTITTTGGEISINGTRNQITGNSITAALSIKGSHLTITENTFLESKSSNPMYDATIAGNHCNISSNHVNGHISISGQNNILSFNNIQGSLTVVTDNSFIHSNNINTEQFDEFSVTGNDNIISKNIVDHIRFGLAVYGSNNKAFLNQITNCRMGISPSAGNTFYANYIADTAWPINPMNHIMNPAGNLSVLVHNNFVNNEIYEVSSLVMPKTTDYFDNGKEGNYWSNYNGTDANGDGVGDTPFYLDSTHLDRYPLMIPFNLSNVAELVPDWLLMPSLHLINLENNPYPIANVTVNFIVNKEMTWLGYSLDGQDNITIDGNITLTNLPTGLHNISVYGKDKYDNKAASETIAFTVASEPFSTVPVGAVSVAVAVVVVAVVSLLLFRRHRKTKVSNIRT